MFAALGFLHAQALRLCISVLKLPFQALAGTIKAMVALAGEEVQRWLGVLVSGFLVYLLAKSVLAFGHPPKPVLWVVALMAALWFYAVLRAAHYTVRNNLLRVRQRRQFQQLSRDVNRVGERVGERITDGMARATEGTPVGRVFGSNRERQAQAEAAAAEAAEDEARRDELAALEPDPY